MKTNVILEANGERCRVKLDANKFPYIVIGNEKIVINRTDFPRTVKTHYDYLELTLNIVEGKDELDQILANPELTADKLSLRQQMRLA